MITQKNNILQYNLLKDEYDHVINDVMSNGYDSNGPYSAKVADKIKAITNRKHVFTTISGTTAIAAGIYSLDLFDKKIAVGSYNYSACVSQFQAFSKTVYVDCDKNTLIDVDQIPSDCDAVMLVNYWGNVVDYDKVQQNFKGKIIADCSQSIGAKYKGKNDGYFGDVSTFAFGGQKPIGTRGFGGAIATDDDDVAFKISCVLDQGRPKEDKNKPVVMIGLRGAPQELQMALIHVGMKYMDQWQDRRRDIAEHIIKGTNELPLRVLKANSNCESSYYKLVVEIDQRDKFISHMREKGVDAQVTYIDDFSAVWGKGIAMPMTQHLAVNTASIPLSPFFTDSEVDTILTAIKTYFTKG